MRRFSVLFITAVYLFLLNPALAGMEQKVFTEKYTGFKMEPTPELVDVRDECDKDPYYPGLEFGSLGKWLGKGSSSLQPEKAGDERQP